VSAGSISVISPSPELVRKRGSGAEAPQKKKGEGKREEEKIERVIFLLFSFSFPRDAAR
jgi:hypothetical protein